MKTQITKNIIGWVIAYSIAMAFLESAVVIYLRELLYPSGFSFPLREMKESLMVVEILREAATVIMLAAIGRFLGNNFTVSFAWFIICFAIWDIFYYVFLYLFLAWPENLLEWDILFLIPIPWYGPVIAPVIISLLMILFGGIILYFREKGESIRVKRMEAFIMLIGCVVVLYSFTEEFIRFQHEPVAGSSTLENIMYKSQAFVPEQFHWPFFITGSMLILLGIILYFQRIRRKNAVMF